MGDGDDPDGGHDPSERCKSGRARAQQHRLRAQSRNGLKRGDGYRVQKQRHAGDSEPDGHRERSKHTKLREIDPPPARGNEPRGADNVAALDDSHHERPEERAHPSEDNACDAANHRR
jgi:hypothetical protein